jgi:hypothetical protein
MKYLIDCLPVRATRVVFSPPPPTREVRKRDLCQMTPEESRKLDISQNNAYLKGLGPSTIAGPPIARRRRAALAGGREAARSQKGNPIRRARRAGNARLALERKSSTVGSILVLSMSRLAGSTAFDVLQGVVFILYFISHIFAVTDFEPANKIMLM